MVDLAARETALSTVTVITPTWQRHQMLLERAIPSVQAQGYPAVEHLVISDGPDPYLRDRLAPNRIRRDGQYRLWYDELHEHDPDPHYGHHCRARGTELAAGGYITYCDDDDLLQPHHCEVLARALDENPDAGFALSLMMSHGPHGDVVIGVGGPAQGNVGTPQIMHRRGPLDVATWDHAGQFEDWDLVWAWIQAGVKYVLVDQVTTDVWPSRWREGG